MQTQRKLTRIIVICYQHKNIKTLYNSQSNVLQMKKMHIDYWFNVHFVLFKKESAWSNYIYTSQNLFGENKNSANQPWSVVCAQTKATILLFCHFHTQSFANIHNIKMRYVRHSVCVQIQSFCMATRFPLSSYLFNSDETSHNGNVGESFIARTHKRVCGQGFRISIFTFRRNF